MAFILKNGQTPATRNSDGNPPVVDQWIRVSKAAATLPATTTATLFNVLGGRILLRALIGEVTTAFDATATNGSIVVDSDAGVADDLASAAAIASLGVGTLLTVEGDGTALLTGGVGWGQAALGMGVVVSPGLIRLTTSATNAGAAKWDLYYLPLDPAAYVTAA